MSNSGSDLSGDFGSQGHRLAGNTQNGSGFDPTDLLDVEPLLRPLPNNGGPTLTHALLSGSPAIDAGNNDYATDWDQRGPGYPRIVNGVIDIGPFEYQGEGPGPPTLREAPSEQPSPAGLLFGLSPGLTPMLRSPTLPAEAATPGVSRSVGPSQQPVSDFGAASAAPWWASLHDDTSEPTMAPWPPLDAAPSLLRNPDFLAQEARWGM